MTWVTLDGKYSHVLKHTDRLGASPFTRCGNNRRQIREYLGGFK